jgi:hypothetical protein
MFKAEGSRTTPLIRAVCPHRLHASAIHTNVSLSAITYVQLWDERFQPIL